MVQFNSAEPSISTFIYFSWCNRGEYCHLGTKLYSMQISAPGWSHCFWLAWYSMCNSSVCVSKLKWLLFFFALELTYCTVPQAVCSGARLMKHHAINCATTTDKIKPPNNKLKPLIECNWFRAWFAHLIKLKKTSAKLKNIKAISNLCKIKTIASAKIRTPHPAIAKCFVNNSILSWVVFIEWLNFQI